MIIEPCCCHNQLPPLCRENKDRLTAFNTNGDVTIEKVMHAVAFLVGVGEMTLILPHVDVRCLNYLRHCMNNGWVTNLNLMTKEDKHVLIETIMGEYNSNIKYLYDKRIDVCSSMFILSGKDYRLCITGYLPPSSPADTDNMYRLTNHTLLYTTQEPPQSLIWDELTRVALTPFRTRCH